MRCSAFSRFAGIASQTLTHLAAKSGTRALGHREPPRALAGGFAVATQPSLRASLFGASHWTLDVTFGEDYCTARTLHAAENRATVTRIAVNLLNRYARKNKCGTKKARMMANQSPEALEEMLAA